MKKYNPILNEDFDLHSAKVIDNGGFVNCFDLFCEAVIQINFYLNEIKKRLLKLKKKVKDSPLNIICYEFSKELEDHKLNFLIQTNPYVKGLVTGETLPESLIINVYIKKELQAIKEKEGFNTFLDQILVLVGHESLHREQMLKSDRERSINSFKTHPETVKYLSNPHEIMVYAWQIINDFRLRGKPDKVILKLLQTKSFVKVRFSKMLELYHKIFKPESSIIKKLYKYMTEYLQT